MTKYSYTVAWSEKDMAYVARVSEFPSLEVYGNSPEAALQELQNIAKVIVESVESILKRL